MKYFAYVLINADGNRTYTGSSGNLRKRIDEHNQGKNFASKPYGPHVLLVSYGFASLSEARQKEKFLKSTTGRRRLKIIVEEWKLKNLK